MAAGKDLRADAVLAKCDECGAPLLGQCIFVEGRRVHRACFKCAGCGIGIPCDERNGEQFIRYYVINGKIYGPNCYVKRL
uniref:LIM zinc-binding domain-containing protein n=1 Tax=Meloidogyne incognita TaxID=6306 RepID=A0A914NF32_MELIC